MGGEILKIYLVYYEEYGDGFIYDESFKAFKNRKEAEDYIKTVIGVYRRGDCWEIKELNVE